MGELLDARWIRRHAMAAPFGVVATTVLLVYFIYPDQSGAREVARSAAGLVDLGAVVYGGIAVVIERIIAMVWWALEQRKKYRAERIAHNERVLADLEAKMWAELGPKMMAELRPGVLTELRTEVLSDLRTEILAEGRAQAFAEMRAKARAQGYHELEQQLERMAQQNGVPPVDPPPA